MRWSAAALLLLLLAALASPLEAAASVAEQLTEADAGYLWAGRPPRKTDRPGGWQEYWFSSDVAGGVLAVGDDANPCTAAAPCLTTAKMLSLAAPGVHIRLDHGDDWNTLTTFTASFDLDLAAIGCPA